MRQANLVYSADVLHRRLGTYHLARLLADPTTQELAAAFGPEQERLEARIRERRDATAAAMTAMAIRDAADDTLDRVVRSCALTVLQKTNGSRQSPIWMSYFPNGLTPLVWAPLESELTRVAVLLARLAEETDPDIAACHRPIDAAAGALRGAVDAHHAAVTAEAQAYGLLQSEKLRWAAAYRRSQRAVALLFHDDPARAERFFKPAPRLSRDPRTPSLTLLKDSATGSQTAPDARR